MRRNLTNMVHTAGPESTRTAPPCLTSSAIGNRSSSLCRQVPSTCGKSQRSWASWRQRPHAVYYHKHAVLAGGGAFPCCTGPAVVYLQEHAVEVHVRETREAVLIYNELADRVPVGGLFHSTC